jgi:hypothetical protein
MKKMSEFISIAEKGNEGDKYTCMICGEYSIVIWFGPPELVNPWCWTCVEYALGLFWRLNLSNQRMIVPGAMKRL